MAGIGKSGPPRPAANRGGLAARMSEMDGLGGLFVEVVDCIKGFKHRIISVPLRMISEVLNICDKMMKGGLADKVVYAMGGSCEHEAETIGC